MPSYNISLQDFSPMLVYHGDWQAFGNTDISTIPEIANYSGLSYHGTNSSGSSAVLNFFGTGIYIEGAKRTIYGTFNVTLDGETSTADASRIDTDIFQTALFSAPYLSVGWHTLTVNCTGEAFDIDFVKVTTGDGNQSTSNSEVVLDDADSSITYLPSSSSWTTTVAEATDYYHNSAHVTHTANASLELNFTGNALELYGSTQPDHGLFTVQIDDGDVTILDASSTQYHKPSVPLYIGGGFASTTHILKVINHDVSTFDIDQIVISIWEDFDTTSPSSGTSEATTSKSQAGLVVGVVIGVLVLLALIGLGIFLIRRGRHGPKLWASQHKVETTDRRRSFSIAMNNQEPDLPRTSPLIGLTTTTSRCDGDVVTPFTQTSFRNMEQTSVKSAFLPTGSSRSQGDTPSVSQTATAQASLSNAPNPGQVPEVVRESDAGPVFVTNHGPGVALRLPPDYEQATRNR